jgi:hypothetical protein
MFFSQKGLKGIVAMAGAFGDAAQWSTISLDNDSEMRYTVDKKTGLTVETKEVVR